MKTLKIAFGMNFLASVLFVINAGVAYYKGEDNYYQYLGLALLFAVLGFSYRRKYIQKQKEESN